MKSKLLLALAAAALAPAAMAGRWTGLSDADHCAGPRISEAGLSGKVVLVDCWGVNCPPCRALLPRMEQLWKSYRSKGLVLVGSHRQRRDDAVIGALVKANKLTYPVYQGFGVAEGEPQFSGIPFLYVVDHRGRIVYAGHGEREATEAVVEAIMKIGQPPSLCGDVELVKYKDLAKQLVWGRSCKSVVSKLKADAKRAQSRFASPEELARAEEAGAILKALESARDEARREIEELKESSPADALKRIKELSATFPEEASAYRPQIAPLMKKAREQAAAKKAAAAKRR